jgi:hypothetical protein
MSLLPVVLIGALFISGASLWSALDGLHAETMAKLLPNVRAGVMGLTRWMFRLVIITVFLGAEQLVCRYLA